MSSDLNIFLYDILAARPASLSIWHAYCCFRQSRPDNSGTAWQPPPLPYNLQFFYLVDVKAAIALFVVKLDNNHQPILQSGLGNLDRLDSSAIFTILWAWGRSFWICISGNLPLLPYSEFIIIFWLFSIYSLLPLDSCTTWIKISWPIYEFLFWSFILSRIS